MIEQDALKRAFLHGLEMAKDPRNAEIADPDTPRTTTIYSPWYRSVCRVCHHTFREDDLVLPHPTRPGLMIHEDPSMRLTCMSRLQKRPAPIAAVADENVQIRTAFLQGLHAEWHPNEAVQSVTIEAGSPFIGRQCPVCRHTARIGDSVVLCPCGRDCGGIFHQDISRHLTCWDSWERSARRSYCAFTGAPFPPDYERL